MARGKRTKPFEGVVPAPGERADWTLSEDELYWQEQAVLDKRERAAEAGQRPSLPITDAWSTVQQAASRNRLSDKTIRKEIKLGNLKATVHPKGATGKQARYRIKREDEEAWVEGRKQPPAVRRPPARAKPVRSFREKARKA
jgi:hypothetical protein